MSRFLTSGEYGAKMADMSQFRQALIVLSVCAAAFGIFFLLPRAPDAYGLREILRGRPAPAMTVPETYTTSDEAPLSADQVPLLERLNEEYARLTAAVVPAVVAIDSLETVAVPGGIPGLTRQMERPLGSGVIVTREGHILTSTHVVSGRRDIRVTYTTPDGRRRVLAAEFIGAIESYDIAVLKLVSLRRDFPALKMGDSSAVRTGQIVFAVGNPYGLSETVTQGIISALDRRISDAGPSYFQTDTPINPGNSGGPLVNHRGEVIGINTAVLRGNEAGWTAQGIGFAIPSNQAWEAFQLITGRGRPRSSFLGLAVMEVTPRIASVLGMDEPAGVMVEMVLPGGPAALAGLRPMDVILEINGRTVENRFALLETIRTSRPGDRISLKIQRAGKMRDLVATTEDAAKLAELQARQPAGTPPTAMRAIETQAYLRWVGLRTGMNLDGKGVRVEFVMPGSLADGRITEGDRILAVNGTPVSSPAAFHRALIDAANDNELVLTTQQDDVELDIRLAPRN